MTAFDIVAKMTLDRTAYDSGLKDAETKAGGFGSKLKTGLKAGIGVIGVATGAVTAVSGAFAAAANKTAEYGDKVDKQSQKIGISAQSYQKWDYVMQRAGTSVDNLKMGMKTMSQQVVKNAEEFQQLGISQEELASSSKEEIFNRTIKGLAGMKDGAERSAIASKLLGRAGADMAPLLNQGTKEIENQMKIADQYGMTMSDEAVKSAAAFEDAKTTFTMTFDGIKNKAMSDFLPAMTQVMDSLAKGFSGDESGFKEAGEGISKFIETAIKKIPTVIKAIGKVLIPAGAEILRFLGQGIVKNAPKVYEFLMNALQTAVQRLAEWDPSSSFSSPFMTKMASGFKKNAPKVLKALGKLALQIAKVLGILALKMLQLGGKLIVSLAKGIGKMAGKAVSAIAKVIAKLIAKAASAVGKLVSTGAQAVVKFVSGILGSIGKAASAGAQLAGKVIGAIKNGITTVASIGRNIVSGIWNGISGSLQWIKDRIKGWVGNVMEFLKRLFKIKSPSRWSRDEIGKNLGLGVALGITDTIGAVYNAMKKLVPDVDYGLSLKAFEPNIGYDLDTYGDDGLMADTFSTLTYTNPFQTKDTAQQAGGTVVYNNTFNVNVNGADNPEDWASRLVRSMKMQARMA